MQLPAAGSVCAYTFTSEFTSLNGIYTLLTIQTFQNALDTGVDFVKSLYTPAGLTASDYASDWENYQNSNVIQLESVTTPTVTIYVPVPIISLTPDPTVKQYNNLALGINLGIFNNTDDVTKLQWLIAQINEIAQSITGTTNAAQLFTMSQTWMTEAAYDTMDTTRTARIQTVSTNYSALQAQIAINNQLKTKIAYYESGLKALAFNAGTSPPPP